VKRQRRRRRRRGRSGGEREREREKKFRLFHLGRAENLQVIPISPSFLPFSDSIFPDLDNSTRSRPLLSSLILPVLAPVSPPLKKKVMADKKMRPVSVLVTNATCTVCLKTVYEMEKIIGMATS